MAFRARKVFGTFEKRAPEVLGLPRYCISSVTKNCKDHKLQAFCCFLFFFSVLEDLKAKTRLESEDFNSRLQVRS